MRVLRKIRACSRFNSSCELTDEQVRRLLGAPSIDCLLMRRRLSYLRRLLLNGVQSSLALLCVRVGTKHELIPWTAQVVNDLRTLQRLACPKLDALGCPVGNSTVWAEFITSFPLAWKQLIDSLVFINLHSAIIVPPTASTC